VEEEEKREDRRQWNVGKVKGENGGRGKTERGGRD
jgi:hypothetical protein